MNRGNTEDFKDSENPLYGTIMIDLYHYTFRQIHRNVQCEFWVIMMYHCRLVSCYKCTSLVGMLIIGEAMQVWRQGLYGKYLCLTLSFVVTLNCSN